MCGEDDVKIRELKEALDLNKTSIEKNMRMIRLVNRDRRAHPHMQPKNPKLKKFSKMKLVPPPEGTDKKKRDKRYLKRRITPSEIRSDEMGKPNFEITRMNDRDILNRNYNTKIVMVKVYMDEDDIAGLRAYYRLESNKVIPGKKMVVPHPNYTVQSFELEEGDYIKYISGCVDINKNFKYIKLASA